MRPRVVNYKTTDPRVRVDEQGEPLSEDNPCSQVMVFDPNLNAVVTYRTDPTYSECAGANGKTRKLIPDNPNATEKALIVKIPHFDVEENTNDADNLFTLEKIEKEFTMTAAAKPGRLVHLIKMRVADNLYSTRLFMPFEPGITVWDFFDNKIAFKALKPEEVISFFIKLTNKIIELHTEQHVGTPLFKPAIVHNDLNGENILVEIENTTMHDIDYGKSEFLQDKTSLTEITDDILSLKGLFDYGLRKWTEFNKLNHKKTCATLYKETFDLLDESVCPLEYILASLQVNLVHLQETNKQSVAVEEVSQTTLPRLVRTQRLTPAMIHSLFSQPTESKESPECTAPKNSEPT